MTQKDLVAARGVLKPRGHLCPKAVLSIFALTTPVFAVIYWLAIPSGTWPIVVVLHLIALAASILTVSAYFNTAVTVGPQGITVRDCLVRTRTRTITAGDVGSIVLLDLYETNTLDTAPQLFVCDHEGRPLLRMRGQFWARSSMQQVVDAFDCPVTAPPESVSLSDLRRTSPELLHWFERGLRMRRP